MSLISSSFIFFFLLFIRGSAFDSETYAVYTAIPLLAHGIGAELGIQSYASFRAGDHACAKPMQDMVDNTKEGAASASILIDDEGCAYGSKNEHDPAPALVSVVISASLKGSASILGETLASLVALKPALLVVLVTDAPDVGAAKTIAVATARVASAILASKSAATRSALDSQKDGETVVGEGQRVDAGGRRRRPPYVDSVYFFDSETTLAVQSVLRNLEGRGILSFRSISSTANASSIAADGEVARGEGGIRPEIFAFHWLPRIVDDADDGPSSHDEKGSSLQTSNAAAAASALLQYSLNMKGHLHDLIVSPQGNSSSQHVASGQNSPAGAASAKDDRVDDHVHPLVARNMIQRRGVGLLQILASISEATFDLKSEFERRAAVEKLLMYANNLCFKKHAWDAARGGKRTQDGADSAPASAGAKHQHPSAADEEDEQAPPSVRGACWFLSLAQNIAFPAEEEGNGKSKKDEADLVEPEYRPSAASVDYFIQLSKGLSAQKKRRETSSTENEERKSADRDAVAVSGTDKALEADHIASAESAISRVPTVNDSVDTNSVKNESGFVVRFHALFDALLGSLDSPPLYPSSPFPSLPYRSPSLDATTTSDEATASSNADATSKLESLLEKEQTFALTLLELISIIGSRELCEMAPRLSPSKLATLAELLHIAGGGWADMIIAATSSRGSPPLACALLAYSPFAYAYVDLKDMFEADAWMAGIYIKMVTLLIEQGSPGNSIFYHHLQRLMTDILDLGRTQGFSYDLPHVQKILQLEIFEAEDDELSKSSSTGGAPPSPVAAVRLRQRIEASMAILKSMPAAESSGGIQMIVLPVPLQVMLHCKVWLAADASLDESRRLQNVLGSIIPHGQLSTALWCPRQDLIAQEEPSSDGCIVDWSRAARLPTESSSEFLSMRVLQSALINSDLGLATSAGPLLHIAIHVGELPSANFPHFVQVAIAARSIDLALRDAYSSIPQNHKRRGLLLSFVIETNTNATPWSLIAQRSFEESLSDTFFRSGEDSPIPMELRVVSAENASSAPIDVLVLNYPNLCSSEFEADSSNRNQSSSPQMLFTLAAEAVIAVDPISPQYEKLHARDAESKALDARLCNQCLSPLLKKHGDKLVLVSSLSQLSTALFLAANSLKKLAV